MPSNLPIPPSLKHLFGPAVDPGEIARLGPFPILAFIGAGGMGFVCKAREKPLNRIVALKAMKPEYARKPVLRQMFEREAQAMAAVHHDHVATIFSVHTIQYPETEAGEAWQLPCLLMEYLEGETLRARMSRGPVSVEEAVRVTVEVAEGLRAIHGKGLIHRDLKPENLWLEAADTAAFLSDAPAYRVKILDFGLARMTDEPGVTQLFKSPPGTPAYMAPEQIDRSNLDMRCDLFSLGCILYAMLTGSAAFRGFDRSLPRPPHEVNTRVPQQLSAVVMKLLALNPRDRYQSANELLAALGVQGALATSGAQLKTPTPADLAEVPPHESKPARAKGTRRILAAVLAVLLLGGGAVAWQAWSGGQGNEDSSVRVISVEPINLNAVPPFHVTTFAVHHFAVYQQGMQHRGALGEKSFATHFGDAIKIEANLSEPAYAYMLLFNANGSEQLVWPVNAQNRPDPQVRPGKVTRVIAPSAQSRRSLYLNDEPRGGWQAVALVLSRQPLPAYADWLRERGPAGWGKEAVIDSAIWAWASPHFTVADSSLALWMSRSPINTWVVAGQGVFGHDHEGLYRRLPGGRTLRAKEQEEFGLPQVERLAKLLRKVGGVELVEMVAFAVRPKEDE